MDEKILAKLKFEFIGDQALNIGDLLKSNNGFYMLIGDINPSFNRCGPGNYERSDFSMVAKNIIKQLTEA